LAGRLSEKGRATYGWFKSGDQEEEWGPLPDPLWCGTPSPVEQRGGNSKVPSIKLLKGGSAIHDIGEKFAANQSGNRHRLHVCEGIRNAEKDFDSLAILNSSKTLIDALVLGGLPIDMV